MIDQKDQDLADKRNKLASEPKDEKAESSKVIGEGTTNALPGDWQIGNKGPLTPERAAEGDRSTSDAV